MFLVLEKQEEKCLLRILTHSLCLNVLMAAGFALLFFATEQLSGYLWTYGLWWYPFFFIVPGLALDLAYLVEWCSRIQVGKWLKKGIDILGTASFEIFLIHISVFNHVKAHGEMNGAKWVILSIVVLVLGVIYQKGIEKGKEKIMGTRGNGVKKL